MSVVSPGAPFPVTGTVADGAAVAAGDAPVLIAGQDGTNVQTIRTATDGTVRTDPTGTTVQPVSGTVAVSGLSVNAITAFTPDPITHFDTSVNQPLAVDPANNLLIRGQVITDEGAFRDDFGGTDLVTVPTGTISVTSGLTTVTGTGTLFTTQIGTNSHIRLSAHANSALTRVKKVISDTSLELMTGYAGATGSGAYSQSFWLLNVSGTGASYNVGSSLLNLISGTANAGIAGVSRQDDYLPFIMTASLSLSARIANQRAVIGFENVAVTPTVFSKFEFDGTNNTTVKCRSAFDAQSIQETVVTLPNGALTSAQNVYRIDQNADRAVFLINGIQVATHETHIPGPYATVYQVAYITNSAVVASTTMAVDVVFFYNHDTLDIAEPVAIQGSPGGNPVIVQFGGPGGVLALPKLINVNFDKSEGAIVANVFKRVATYTVPAAYNGYLIKYVSFQAETAASRVVAETNMGTHNDNTNTFVAGTQYVTPQWTALTQAEVTTAFAAGAGNVVLTVGYTNESGTAGRSGTITIPKGSAVGSRWSLVLQGTDLGVTSIQSCSGTPSQVGIVKILGLIQLAFHEDQSTTSQTETIYAPGAITFPTGTVLGVEYAGGTVAKQRILDVLIQLVQ
jgi:hypothetical protein